MLIAVVGDNASLRMGGEALKPLKFFRGYRRCGLDCMLIVHERCRSELAAVLSPGEFADVTFVKESKLEVFVHWCQTRVRAHASIAWSNRILSLLFQRGARRTLRRIAPRCRPDIIHQATPISPYLPSMFHGLSRPVIIGPMAVRPPYPPGFRREGQERKFARSLRLKLGLLANFLVPGKRRSSLIFSANSATTAVLNRTVGKRVKIIETLENAVDPEWFDVERRHEHESVPHFVFVGSLVKWKCVDILLNAGARFGGPVRISILGDGPERDALQSVASKIRNVDVRFSGWLTHCEIQEFYRTATAAVSVSVREAGGTSVQEAMAAGVPVIATAWGGHLLRLEPGAGLLIKAGPREDMIEELADAMRRVARDPGLAERLGRRAREIALERMTWESKISLFVGEMEQIVRSRAANGSGAPRSPCVSAWQ